MVGWGFAFGRGIVVWLWSIAWFIIGFVVAVVITGGSLLAAVSDPSGFIANPGPYVVGIFIGGFVGSLVTTIGIFATVVKISVDAALAHHEEMGHGQSLPFGYQPTKPKNQTLQMAEDSENRRA